MNIVKARAAVEYAARRLAQAMDAADNLAVKAQQAHLEAAQIALQADEAYAAVHTAATELEAAEAELLGCQHAVAETNGQASGSAHNPTIRIDYPDL